MKIKVDEHLVGRTVIQLLGYGHDVDSVQAEGLAGADDLVIYAAAQREGRMLFTIDKDLSDVRDFPLGEHAGLVFLRLRDTRQATISEAVEILHDRYNPEDLQGCLVVVRPPYIRITRP